jgi:hypothetical protein
MWSDMMDSSEMLDDMRPANLVSYFIAVLNAYSMMTEYTLNRSKGDERASRLYHAPSTGFVYSLVAS